MVNNEHVIEMSYQVKTGNERISKKISTSSTKYIFPELSTQGSCCIVFTLATLCYISSLEGGFVFDDTEAILNNADVKNETPIIQLFYNDFWGTNLKHPSSHKSYRPLTILSFRLNYILSGGLNAMHFHLINLVLHSTVSALSTLIFSIIFEEDSPRLSFVTAVIFAIHPVHTEAVTGIVGRADLLCGLFYFLSIYSYVTYLNKKRLKYFVWSIVCCAVAMLCKEQGITVLGVNAIYELVAVRLNFRKFRSKVSSLKGIAVHYSWMLVVGLILLYLRLKIMGSTVPVFQRVDNPASFAPSWLTRALTYNYIYSIHALLLILPHWLCFDWSMGCIPLIHTIYDPRNMASAVFWILLISACLRALFSSSPHQRRYLMLGLALIGVPFLPATNLFFRVGFVVAERVLFIPVAGYCVLFIHGLEKLNTRFPYSNLWRCCLLFMLVLYGLKSVHRSMEWRDEAQLFRAALKVCPLNAKVHYNIGKNAADQGLRDVAISRYQTALQLNPEYDQAMNNLANLLKDSGQIESAEEWLLKAVSIRPDFAAAWMNLGIVQALLKKYSEARASYLKALTHRRKYPDCYYNLGNLYLELEQFDEAYDAFRSATSIQTSHVLAWTNLIVMFDNIGQPERSELTALEALKFLPREANLHFSLAGILGKQNRFEESEKHFLAAIEINPDNPIYHTNLGVLYHRWKKYEQAERSYRKALDLNPQWKSATDNLRLLLKNKPKVP